MAHKLPIQKGPKQIPEIIFDGLKTTFSKNTVKMAPKRIKNVFQKIFFYRPHRKILLI
jgi:hypothetical protein